MLSPRRSAGFVEVRGGARVLKYEGASIIVHGNANVVDEEKRFKWAFK